LTVIGWKKLLRVLVTLFLGKLLLPRSYFWNHFDVTFSIAIEWDFFCSKKKKIVMALKEIAHWAKLGAAKLEIYELF
jgi:hypothetical protein